LARGTHAGVAKTSPRKANRAPLTGAELLKWSAALRPADRRAVGDAGMTPRLATMAKRFNTPPKATTPKRARPRLRHRSTLNTT
jgi:hypothetical protein